MTLGAFRALVLSMTDRFGVPYLAETDVSSLNALLQEGLNVYAKETQCLYAANVKFYSPSGVGPFVRTYNPKYSDALEDYSSTAPQPYRVLDLPMCSVEQVFLNGTCLLQADSGSLGVQNWVGNPYGLGGLDFSVPNYGMSSETEVIKCFGSYLTAAAGVPAAWFLKSPNTIGFNCSFVGGILNSWFSGCLYHSPLTNNDSQVLDFADEDIRPAARVCRNLLLEPLELEAAAPLQMASAAQMSARKGQAGVRNVGNAQRAAWGASRGARLGL
jgi:hypothetical protein